MHVEMLKGLKKTDEGATVKEFAYIPGMETDFASQVVVDEVISEDQRFLEKAALPIEEEFPIGSRAFFVGEFNYGRPLEVIGHKDKKAEIWVAALKDKEAEFGRDLVSKTERTTPYTPSYHVAKMLGLHPLVLSKITSSFTVNVNGLRVNLGLNLKFEAKKLKVLGYSRRSDSGWEFSQKAIELLTQYMIKFPEFIAGIQRKQQGNDYDATDFFPDIIAKTKFSEITAWLKSVETKNFEKVPLDAMQLDSDSVMLVEKKADEMLANGPGIVGKKLKDVPRNALLKPSDAEHRLGNQRFDLGDRVVYVQDSGRVPIATRGTVVGVSRTARTTLLDVVFDVTFMSGTTLGDRCSPFRGSTIPITSVINLTNRQVVAYSRTSVEKRPASTSQPLTANGYGMPTGPGHQGQYREAGAPPPLRGSFKGAVAGTSNGYRGNGMSRGRGRGGLNSDDPQNMHNSMPFRTQNGQGNGSRGRSGQTNGFRGRGQALGDGVQNSNPRPHQSFNAMPPPPSLDARGGRGRGRGGSRGEGWRGRGTPRGRGVVQAQVQ